MSPAATDVPGVDAARSAWRRVRSFFEAPILDDRKWAKVPSIPADAFFLDMEDSVPLAMKDRARAKVVEYLSMSDYFGDAQVLPRVNHLSTPWGHDDVVALGEAGARVFKYPKVEHLDEIEEVLALFATTGAHPSVAVSIESARGVVEVERLLAHPSVFAIGFGSADFALDAGRALYRADGLMSTGLDYAKSRTTLAASANGLGCLSVPWVTNVRDLDQVEISARGEKELGFTGGITFYPPHVDVLNRVFGHSPEELAQAREVVAVYEEAVAQGKPAVQLANGEVVLVHQYKEAQLLLEMEEQAPA